MENASKALIIAGAILISISLITLGVLIFKQASGFSNTDAISEVEKETFNSKFTQYEGTQSGRNIKTIYNKVLVNNMDQDSTDRKVKITSSCGNLEETDTVLPDLNIETGSKYEVTCILGTSGGETGLVQEIKIEKVTK